eukprot:5720329-Amphidinium_carterae.1
MDGEDGGGILIKDWEHPSVLCSCIRRQWKCLSLAVVIQRTPSQVTHQGPLSTHKAKVCNLWPDAMGFEDLTKASGSFYGNVEVCRSGLPYTCLVKMLANLAMHEGYHFMPSRSNLSSSQDSHRFPAHSAECPLIHRPLDLWSTGSF